MKKTLLSAGALAMTAAVAQAGGIERAANNYGLLFADGDQIELSFSSVSPEVSGDYTPTLATLGGQASTGNMAGGYSQIGFGYKNEFNDKLSFGLFVNQPYGADALYSGGFYNGLRAVWESQQLAAILKYQATDRVSVYGGFRYVRSTADITIPDQMIRASTARNAAAAGNAAAALLGAGVPATDARVIGYQTLAAQLGAVAASPTSLQYDATGDQSGEWGYVVGAAYEIPDIALRVALTYESAITHSFDTTETLPGFGLNLNSSTEIEMPQSVALDFQSGIAKGTLVFGQIKWTEWSVWEVRPAGYDGITGTDVTSFDNDVVTWKLGVGRQFSDNFSGFAQIGFEKSNGGIASRLSPTDGRKSLGIGGQYTQDNVKIRFGAEYVVVGDATDASGVQFSDNNAFGVGMSVSFGF
ncbi:MAG: outer membrane protein transport protein [Roseivivax sp.]|nr:outer membrane protein transport protein [Roseivivax sp.]